MADEHPQESTEANQAMEAFRRMNAGQNVQALYMNSLALSTTVSDLSITIMINGLPTHQIFMAFPTAKSLFLSLEKALAEHERTTKGKILGIEETQKIISSNQK
jgi:hypothetical protein